MSSPGCAPCCRRSRAAACWTRAAAPDGCRRERVPAASFTVGDLGERLPHDGDSFDVAVPSLVMHYLRDWVPTLRELRRVLRPEGVFVLSTHQATMDAELADSDDYFRHRAAARPLDRGRARV